METGLNLDPYGLKTAVTVKEAADQNVRTVGRWVAVWKTASYPMWSQQENNKDLRFLTVIWFHIPKPSVVQFVIPPLWHQHVRTISEKWRAIKQTQATIVIRRQAGGFVSQRNKLPQSPMYIILFQTMLPQNSCSDYLSIHHPIWHCAEHSCLRPFGTLSGCIGRTGLSEVLNYRSLLAESRCLPKSWVYSESICE